MRRVFTLGDSTTDRTVTGGVWIGLNNVVDRVLQLGVVLFMARLLDPTAFGLLGIALVAQSALMQLTQLGLDTALIQHTDDDVDTYLDTVWTVELLRGVCLGTVLFLVAPLVSAVFGEPRVTDILRVLALPPVLSGLNNPGTVYLLKDLEFDKHAVFTLSSRFVYVPVAVGFGYVLRSVWALIFAMVAASITSLVASYVIHPYRPRPRFDRSAADELFEYGKWIFGSQWLIFLINEGDDAFVGWMLGAPALGVYQLSYRLSNAPATEITQPIQRVVFPAYATIQDNVDALRRGYLMTVRIITFLSFPASVGIVVVAPLFVDSLLGHGWAAAVVPMQVLGVYAAFRSFRSSTLPLFNAIGRPDYDTKLRVVKLALIVPFIYPAAQAFGLPGVAFVLLGHTLVVSPLASYVAIRSVGGSVRELLAVLSYPALGSVSMGVVVFIAREHVVGLPAILELAFLVLTGAVVYTVVMLVLERQVGIGIDDTYQLLRDGIG